MLLILLLSTADVKVLSQTLITGVIEYTIMALVGWFFFNSVNVLLGSIKMSEDILLVRYNEKLLFIMKTFRTLAHDQNFQKNKTVTYETEPVQQKIWTGNRYDADYTEIFKGYQLRWLLYQDLHLGPNALGKFMDSRQLMLVSFIAYLKPQRNALLTCEIN